MSIIRDEVQDSVKDVFGLADITSASIVEVHQIAKDTAVGG